MNGYNFTDRVRKVLQIAREEAARLHHEYVGTEHLLLALLREGQGVAAAALMNLSVDFEELTHNVESVVKEGKYHGELPDSPYTSRAKKVLELSMTEARELNHSYVGTEHLLLGVLREEKGIGAQALGSAGVTPEVARAEVIRLLGQDEAFRTGPPDFAGELDQRFKTAIALIELHRIRAGAYPLSLNEIQFLGWHDQGLFTRLRYERLSDGYALDIVATAGTTPDLSYPPAFWRGLGIRRTNVDRSPEP